MSARTSVILVAAAALAVAGPAPGAATATRSFPFVLGVTPVVSPGGAGAWDAGGVFGPRVWRNGGRTRMLYVGMRHTETFDNELALGAAEEAGGGFEKSPRNPILRAGDIAPEATGIEMVALTAANDDAVTFVATVVDAKRKPVGFYRVTLAVDGWRVMSIDRLTVAPVRPGDWNSAFYIPGAWDPGTGLLVGEGTGPGLPWAIGAQAVDGDALVWLDDPATRTPFATSDPVLGPSPGSWDRRGMFNPSVFHNSTGDLLLYSGAPGQAGSDDAAHTIGYAVRRDGAWVKLESDSRLIAPQPGSIIEHPMLLAEAGGGARLFVSVRPSSTSRAAIHVASGVVPVDDRRVSELVAYADARPRWTPDNTRVVFQSDRAGHFDVYSVRADGTGLVRITRGSGDEVQPAVSPDGRWLAYAAHADRSVYTGRSRYQIYVARVDGAGAARLMTSDGSDFFPVWSPDGTQIAFMSDRSGRTEIYVAAANGSNVRPLTAGHPGGPRGNPTWSPDGTLVAFDTALDGKSEIATVSVRDGTWTVVTSGLPGEHWFPSWSPNGREIAFGTFSGSGQSMTHRLSALQLSNRTVRHLTRPTPPGSGRFDYHQTWASDGHRLVFSSNRSGTWRLHVITALGTDDRELFPRSPAGEGRAR